MKRRLSDADELAFWWAAQFCDRTGDRPMLSHVMVDGGRVWGTDTYTLASFPVEADWSGLVWCGDALAGSTVEVLTEAQVTGPDASYPNVDGLIDGFKVREHGVLDVDEVERLRPWLGRKPVHPRQREETTLTVAYLAPRSVWGGQALVLPCGDFLPGRMRWQRGPTHAFQAPFAARAVVAVADLCGGGVRVDGGTAWDPIRVTPIGDWTPDDPWAVFMGLSTPIAGWKLPVPVALS